MIAYSASDAKQNFAAMVDAAAREPVVIRRHYRDVAMVISPEQYRKLHRLNAEELMRFAESVGTEAEKNGMTDEVLAEILAGND